MNASPSLSTYDLTLVPTAVFEEDISVIVDIDLFDTNLFKLCTPTNQKEERIKFDLTRSVGGRSNNSWMTGLLSFDGAPVVSFDTSGSVVTRRIQKIIIDELLYLEMIQYLASFYSSTTCIVFTLEGDEHEVEVPRTIPWDEIS